MDAKRHAKQGLGIAVFLVGCILSLMILRALTVDHISNFWTAGQLALNLSKVGGMILLVSLALYCVCSGLRLINPQLIKLPRFGWGKILFGLWILFGEVESHYHLVPEGPLPIFKPSNPTQAASMKVTGIVISLVCVYLIIRGIRAGFSRSESHSHAAFDVSLLSGRET